MARDEAEADAEALHTAMTGARKNESSALDILAERSPTELGLIRAAFDRKFSGKGGLVKWISTETDSDNKELLASLGTAAPLPPRPRPVGLKHAPLRWQRGRAGQN